MQGDNLRGHAACAVHVELDVLSGDIGPCVLHHLAERGLGNVKALHAVVVKDAEVNLDELVADEDVGDAGHDTLLSEARDDAVEVGAFLEADALDDHVVEELEAEPSALTCLGGLVNHRLDKRLVDILGTGHGVELLAVVLLDFLDDLGFLFFLAFLLGVAGERVDHLLPLASFLGFLFLVPEVLFGLILPLAFHAAILDAVELTGIGVEILLLAPAAAAIAASAIAVDTVHVGTLTLTEVLLGFQLTEAFGIDGIDALTLLVVVAAAGGVLLFVLFADAVDGGKGSVLGKMLVHRRHLVVHSLTTGIGDAHVDGVGDDVPCGLAVAIEGLHAEVDEPQQGQEDDQRENVLGLSEVQTLEFL